MLLVPCPYCGLRPEIEFSYAGEAHIVRPLAPSVVDDAAWGEYLYARSNEKGVHRERWRHVHGCGRYFNAIRDTVSDQFLCAYEIGTQPPAAAGR